MPGNINGTHPTLRRLWVHPRVCGECWHAVVVAVRRRGSPPRMRGISQALASHTRGHGFTPAYAGNTDKSGWFEGTSAGSPPRMRGILAPDVDRVSSLGSPPRMRGICAGRPRGPAWPPVHPRVCGEYSAPSVSGGNDRGFTPAYAGNMLGRRRWRRPTPVHPRVCGEYKE